MLRYLSEKNRWIRLIVLLEAIILLICVFFYSYRVNHLIRYQFDVDQLASYTAEEYEDCIGGTIDESYAPGWYIVIPTMYLRKGFYQYSVSYAGSADGGYVLPYIPSDYYNVMEEARVYLEGGKAQDRQELWVNIDLEAALWLSYDGNGTVTLTDFLIWETPYRANITLFSIIAFLVVADILIALYAYQKCHSITKQSKYVFAGLMTIILFSSCPLFLDYMMGGYDIFFHLTRIEGLMEGLLEGQFPVRINPTFYNGYGYANPVFYGELFLYIPAFLRLVGFPLTKCYNVYGIIVNTFTCLGGYYCFKRMFQNRAVALAGSLLYTMAPYRLTDIYVRAALGEYTAMAFLPFVVYGMYRIYTEDVHEKKYRWCFLPLAVGLTGIIQSHVLTGEMIGGIILLVCVLLFWQTLQKERFCALVKTVFVTIGINLWFLVPFLDFMLTQDVRVLDQTGKSLVQATGLFLPQILLLFQKYVQGISLRAESGIAGEMPLTLGMPLVLGMILCAVMVCSHGRKLQKERKRGLFLLLLAVLVTWMSTIYFPWDNISLRFPFLKNLILSIQYVWRFLAPATILAVIVTGFGILLLQEKEGTRACVAAGVLLCVLTVVSGMLFMQDCLFEEEGFRLNSILGVGTVGAGIAGEYLPKNAEDQVMTEILEPRIHNGEIVYYEKQGTTINFTVNDIEEDCYVLLPLLKYKGYRVVSEDGSITNDNLSTGESAEIRIDIPKGYNGLVTVRYQSPWYWRVAEILSVFCILLLMIAYHRDKQK